MPTRGKPAGLPLVSLTLIAMRVLAPTAMLVGALLLASAPGPRLQVTSAEGDLLLDISLATDPSWIVRWNHSVTGILVSDYYRYEGEQMLLTDTHTPAFDAGLGHIPGRGRLESDGTHGYWIREIDEPVSGNAYSLRVGSLEVDHRIVHAGTVYSLSELAAGERVMLKVAR